MEQKQPPVKIKSGYYVSIRIVKADNEAEAFDKIMCEDFDVSHDLCDKVMPLEQLKEELS